MSAGAIVSASKPMPNPDSLALAMTLRQMFTGYWVSQSIYAVAKLGVADVLRDGPKDIGQLGQALHVDKSGLYRVMRTLAALGLFAEDHDQRFRLTPLGSLLQTDVPGSMRSMAIWNGAWRSRRMPFDSAR